jgi:hypothetical protein
MTVSSRIVEFRHRAQAPTAYRHDGSNMTTSSSSSAAC